MVFHNKKHKTCGLCFSNKKGQAAMEFLMTYGWALLVVLIAIAALAFFGLLNPSRFLPEKCELAPGLTCMDHSAAQLTRDTSDPDTAKITLLVNNGIGQTMRNVIVNVTACDNSAIGPTVGTISQCDYGNTAWNSADPEDGLIITSCLETGLAVEGTFLNTLAARANVTRIAEGATERFDINCTEVVPANRFKSDMIISYDVEIEGNIIHHSKSGYLVVEIEEA